MTASEAKEFIIGRILDEARRQSVPLSETEKEMLYWTEVHPEPHIHDLQDLARRFDHECDSDTYETKVAALLRDVRKRDSADDSAKWKAAEEAIAREDHYIGVIILEAGGS